jgi:hypothetical protein
MRQRDFSSLWFLLFRSISRERFWHELSLIETSKRGKRRRERRERETEREEEKIEEPGEKEKRGMCF